MERGANMVDPNWGLLQGNQSQQYFNNGMQQGNHLATTGRARSLDNALASYAKDPNQQGLNGVIDRDPRLGMQLQDREAQRREQEAKEGREKAMTVAKLFDNIPDEATYQQRMGMAQRMGIDVSTAPPNYDPAWVAENGAIMRFVAEKPEAVSTAGKMAVDEGYQPGTPEFNGRVKQIISAEATKTIPYQPGGGVATYNTQTGKAEVIVQPNDGSGQPGAPTTPTGNIPTARTPAEASKLKPGSQFYDDKGVLRMVPGGASGNAGGGFRPVSDGKGIVQQLFPSARVKSGYRGPDHPLSKKNPGSWHSKSKGAVDIAPIPGMTFDQYVSKVKASGYQVIEARDEVSNPSSHATGPHWHIVIGES